MPARDSAFAVILRRDRVLLVKPRGASRWQLPGGGVKPHETPWVALLREVEEETGIEARVVGLSGMYRRNDGSLAFVFAARVGWQVPEEGLHEIAKCRWVPLRKAVKRLARSARERLLDAVRRPAGLRAPVRVFRAATVARFEVHAIRFNVG